MERFKTQWAEEVSVATVNRHLVLLKATFNRAIKAGKAVENPVKGVKLFKENNTRTRQGP